MSGREEIHIEVAPAGISTGNALPLLHEISHALRRLIEHDEPAAFDLLSLPMTTSDVAELIDRLGRGEIEVNLNALGRSLIRETAYPGVWLVEHYNADEQIVARLIEVTLLPDIVRTDRREIEQGRESLDEMLAQAEPMDG